MGSTVFARQSDAEMRKESTWVSGKWPGGGRHAEGKRRSSATQVKRKRALKSKKWRTGAKQMHSGRRIEGRRWPMDGQGDHWYIGVHAESRLWARLAVDALERSEVH